MTVLDLVEHSHWPGWKVSRSTYVEGCRCPGCRAAEAAYQRLRPHCYRHAQRAAWCVDCREAGRT